MTDWNKIPSAIETIARCVRDEAVHRVISTIRDDGQPFEERDLHDAADLAARMAMERFSLIVKHEIALIELAERRRGEEMMMRPVLQFATAMQDLSPAVREALAKKIPPL